MPLLSHSLPPQRLPPRCPRTTEGSPPPASAAIGPGRPSGILLENGGIAQQAAYAIDRRALPGLRRSMDAAARAGAQVIGCDISTNWLEKARGLVAAELTRVCRPGGMIAMANWTPGGFVGQMFITISKHLAPSGTPAPAPWGDEATVRDRLHEGIADLKFALRINHFDYPFSPDAVVDFYRTNYGPMSRAFTSLDVNGQEKLRSELVRLWSAHNYSDRYTTKVDAEYLEVIAT